MQNAQKHQPFNLHHAIQICPSMENKPEKGLFHQHQTRAKPSRIQKHQQN
jgi:hypothetical protein